MKNYKAEIQAAITRDYGNILIKSIHHLNKECFVTTDNDELKYLHGEFSDFLGKGEEWIFDEHHADDFKTKNDFIVSYGY